MAHPTHEGALKFGTTEIPAFVLEDKTRVLSTRGVMQSLGRKWRGRKYPGTELPVFLEAKNLTPFISNELRTVLSTVKFRVPKGSAIAEGFRAETLPMICDVYLAARRAGNVLTGPQERVAMACEILVSSLSKVGIIALVDEATGFQRERAKDALAEILEKFIAKELQAWTKTFPVEFYEHIFRLHGWPFSPQRVKRPSVIGHYTNNIIYKRLAPGVLEQLRERNPVVDGRRKHTHFQWLTGEIGHPKLRSHIDGVLALMRVSDTWEQFTALVKKAYPIIETTELGMEIELREK